MRPSPHLAMSRESGGSFWNLTLEIGRMQGYLRPGTTPHTHHHPASAASIQQTRGLHQCDHPEPHPAHPLRTLIHTTGTHTQRSNPISRCSQNCWETPNTSRTPSHNFLVKTK
ncbi:hypothetical protein HBI56_234960 [Parastagonospora nodorum]|uniref:Uncharacterized protein n=1 Tax=Phaeosphaeria nodorum (strain SN15 / ATCC MYA-4574 / FGSC 10173) TaxID=321614 RepID=A0A7U2HYW6_PHANO|nr:hypothetical protein HBH56_227630 [Parastagonospora nodorum]QRC95758.1 hypothetical protein JI435_407910 [Parastagonospora nodorum SN15]KAH3921745.1 hypothetical protein HBH54_235160 [Parastagonospora nodorum]KAH3938926.1 hypothetical protein HBH53_243660 [Parastagonospora nodorum]KAH3959016.1 hypothetical protein HBH51_203440 [Parastagonospora nodorum]